MKLRIIASTLLVVLIAGISTQVSAAPWRGHYRGGWYAPRPFVRIAAPRVFIPPVPVPVITGGGYYGRPYYAHPYYGHAYYGHPYHGHHYYHR